MVFNFNIPTISYILFGAALLCVIYICTVYWYRIHVVCRRKKQCESSPLPDPLSMPKVSIIIYARNESEALQENLPLIIKQDYPAGFEIIVVNEGSSPETSMVVSALRAVYPNLYLTFTPDGARNLSRKKLALTLGIKAAKGDVVVITDAVTRIESELWLQSMMRHFANPATNVVLGYGSPMMPASKFAGRLISTFDITADSIPWLSAAISGNPYRGCGYNLAYRRDLFFDNKGFSRSLNLRAGDDDIFINEITNKGNTVVELSDNSRVAQDVMPYARAVKEDRLSHLFTGRRLPKMPRMLMSIGDWTLWLALALSLGAAFFAGVTNLVGWIAAAVIILGSITFYTISWSKAMKALGALKLVFTLPFISIMRPWRKAILSIHSHISKSGHYTWQ